jgi:hypothetical protein
MTLTDKTIISEMHKFNSTAKRIAFSIAVETEAGIEVHRRQNQPCWGELRTHYKDIRKPSDLHSPFPDGVPVGIGISLRGTYDQDILSFLLGRNSPYNKCFGENGLDFTMSGNEIKGFVLTDTKIDPTPFVHMLINFHNNHISKEYLDAGIPEKIAFLLPIHLPGGMVRAYDMGEAYNFARKTDFKRWWNSNPRDLTTGKCHNGERNTFYTRAAYNRVENNEIWTGPNAVPLAKLLKEKKFPVGVTLDVKTMKNDVLPLIEELINS